MRGSCFSAFLRNFEAGMITDIRDIENFDAYSDPLFEYVRMVANHFWPSYDESCLSMESEIPDRFACRYMEGHVNGFTNEFIKASYLSKYEKNADIQNALMAFGIDKEKFWYLCVCIKDYLNGFARKGRKRKSTPREELTKLVAKKDEMQPKACFLGKDIFSHYETQKNATLTFRLEGERSFSITDPHTISLINDALSYVLNESSQISFIHLDSPPQNSAQNETISDIKQFYWFHKYLSFFLEDKVADKELCKKLSTAQNYVSVDKWLLISRMIFAIGLSNKQGLNRMDYLKNYLKKCNDESMIIETRNGYYEM